MVLFFLLDISCPPKETLKVFGNKITVRQTIHKFLHTGLAVQKHYFSAASTLFTQCSNPWHAFSTFVSMQFYICFPDTKLKLGKGIISFTHFFRCRCHIYYYLPPCPHKDQTDSILCKGTRYWEK